MGWGYYKLDRVELATLVQIERLRIPWRTHEMTRSG